MGCGKREATATIQSLVKLQPWFLSLWWKTCLRQNCSLGFSPCSEGPAFGQNTDDDDDDVAYRLKKFKESEQPYPANVKIVLMACTFSQELFIVED